MDSAANSPSAQCPRPRSRMRRLFGHQKSEPGPSPSPSPAKAAVHQQQNGGTPKKRRPFLPFLRNSLRRQPKAETSTAANDAAGGPQNGALLSPSRTFDAATVSRSPLLSTDRFCPSLSPAPSGCYSEPIRSSGSSAADGQLDRSLMQTCTDVKYENRRRPKFAAVVDANFQRQCLQAHNHVRQLYGCPALQWSQELAELAKSWALKLAQRGRMLYPELPGIGENIFLLAAPRTDALNGSQQPAGATTGDHLTTGTELVAMWAAEAQHLDFGRPGWSEKSRHFTQLVWRGSAEMGVARHWDTQKDCLAIVAFYRPAGNCNLPGEFAANLPSADDLPEGVLEASQLTALSLALNRSDLGDGGFRKSPLQGRKLSPNSTKILKC